MLPFWLTGNDFSKVYAPLIRDGRMEKFYWSPSRTDLISILHAVSWLFWDESRL